MDEIIIQKINEGDSGQMASTKIFKNDQRLRDAIISIKNLLDAYGALVNITVDGSTITLVTEPGQSNTAVMSQKSVTNFVIEETENSCEIGETIQTGVQMPDSGCYVNVWASRASANAQGNSLTVLYDDVQELKKLYVTIAAMQEKIDNLEDRVSTLEAKNNGY